MFLHFCIPLGFSNDLLTGRVSSDCVRNWGPLHHVQQSISSIALILLLKMSAGLWSVDMYRHCSGLVHDCISPTLLAMNCLNSRLRPLIHHRVFKLSDQNIASLIFISKTSAILKASLTPITTPINSSRGILV